MTIEQAIKHVEEVAEEQDKLCKRYDDASGYTRSHNEEIRTSAAKQCEKCADDHRQLGEWLKELKQLREQTTWIPVSERLPERSTWVLVTCKRSDGYVYQNIELINKYTGLWESDDESFCDPVIAWMPLPGPYKAESEEDKR